MTNDSKSSEAEGTDYDAKHKEPNDDPTSTDTESNEGAVSRKVNPRPSHKSTEKPQAPQHLDNVPDKEDSKATAMTAARMLENQEILGQIPIDQPLNEVAIETDAGGFDDVARKTDPTNINVHAGQIQTENPADVSEEINARPSGEPKNGGVGHQVMSKPGLIPKFSHKTSEKPNLPPAATKKDLGFQLMSRPGPIPKYSLKATEKDVGPSVHSNGGVVFQSMGEHGNVQNVSRKATTEVLEPSLARTSNRPKLRPTELGTKASKPKSDPSKIRTQSKSGNKKRKSITKDLSKLFKEHDRKICRKGCDSAFADMLALAEDNWINLILFLFAVLSSLTYLAYQNATSMKISESSVLSNVVFLLSTLVGLFAGYTLNLGCLGYTSKTNPKDESSIEVSNDTNAHQQMEGRQCQKLGFGLRVVASLMLAFGGAGLYICGYQAMEHSQMPETNQLFGSRNSSIPMLVGWIMIVLSIYQLWTKEPHKVRFVTEL